MQCFLQSEDMQRQLEKYLVGIAIRTIPVNKIRQKKLAKIYEDWNHQRVLYEKLICDEEKYYSTVISNVIKSSKEEGE